MMHANTKIIIRPSQLLTHKFQQGVVLFIALIALVVMSLAAVALIRSIDTSTIIAGNLATKQLATISADSGLETAITWLSRPAVVLDPTILYVDSASSGYYASQEKSPTTLSWNANDSLPATGTNIDANGTDASGNTIRYIIQRMCIPSAGGVAAAPAAANCLFGAPVVGNSSQGVRPSPLAGAATTTTQSPMYRITARVTSVKSTVSYIQAFVY